MKKILKLDGYLVLKHWLFILLPFLLCCTAGAALHLWLFARRGGGMAPAISLVLMQMLMLAGSLAVPFTVLLEEKDIGFEQLLALPLDREAWARTKYLQLLLTALLCFAVGAAAYGLSMRQLRPYETLNLSGGLWRFACCLSEMLIGAAVLIPFQLDFGAERGIRIGGITVLLPLHLVAFRLIGLPEGALAGGARQLPALAALAVLLVLILFLSFRRTRTLLLSAVTDGNGLCL